MRTLLLAVLALALGACSAPTLRVQPRYAKLDASGSAGMSSTGISGAADLEQAGLEEDETLSGRIDLEFGSPHLVFLGHRPSFAGTGTLDVTIDDGDDTITAGTTVASEMDFALYDLALVFDLVPGDTVELAIGLGAAYLDVDLEFVEDGTGTVVSSSGQLPVPLLAAVGSVWIGPVEVSAFVGGVDIEYEDDSLTYIDADVFARLKLLGKRERLRASLVLGYRYTDLELDYDDEGDVTFTTDVTFAGPYLGLEVSL